MSRGFAVVGIERELEKRIDELGYELVAVEWGGSKKRPVLRLRVDRPVGEGFTVEDCAVVIFEDGEKGKPDYDPAFLIKQDGQWKVLLKLTDWDEEEFETSEAQKKRLKELDEWFDKEKDRLYGH